METKITEEPGVTMSDFLNDMLQEEEAAQKILSKDETQQCSYGKGYITQNVFGCYTCGAKGGMCLACYLSCHLDHDTFDIGEKRNFRCDCGTDKFSKHPCSLAEDSIRNEENVRNVYDHNFEGKFCLCNSAYDVNQFMIRCLNCQDFFHLYHLNMSEDMQRFVEANEDLNQMICGDCKNKHYKFLLCYKGDNIYYTEDEMKKNKTDEEKKEPQPESKTQEEPVSLGKRARTFDVGCDVKEKLKELADINDKRPILLKENWNDNLCYCDECIELYKEKKVYDILTEEVVEGGEEVANHEVQEPQTNSNEGGLTIRDPNKDESLYTKAMQELSKLDFGTQSLIASLYRDFYDDFKEFFEKFKDGNILITQDHIKEFFAFLKSKNKNVEAPWA